MISFTFDDGYKSTLTRAAPVLRDFGMAATVGAVCDNVFWHGSPEMMRLAELRCLVDAGWEVASHSMFHRRLPLLPPSYDDEAAEWGYDILTDAFVADCKWEDISTIVNKGTYLQRANSLDHLRRIPRGFVHDLPSKKIYARTGDKSKDNAELRFGSAEREIAESRTVFENNGFDVTSFIVPFSMWPDRLHPFGARYYPIVATVRGKLNKIGETSSTQLSRIQINKDRTVDNIVEIITHHISNNSWAIVCFHRIVDEIERKWDWEFSEFRRLVEWVAASSIPVVTLSSGTMRLTS